MYYNRFIMERFQYPVNAGGMHGANAIGEVVKENCHDLTRLYLKIDDKSVIENAKFKTFGCCASIVSADVTCDLVKGKTIEEALQITNQDVLNIMGELPEGKERCSIMAEETIQSAIDDYYKRREKDAKKALKKASTIQEVDEDD